MKKGRIVYLFDNTPAVVCRIHNRIWASVYYVIPLSTGSFYIEGQVEEVLISQVKEL